MMNADEYAAKRNVNVCFADGAGGSDFDIFKFRNADGIPELL